ncbi:hypothetical protein [Duganella qianjiadongensis]|uniref:Uncharacterized protein n=1 Tax=Duganella qianjiadongensis TaxID=2692176 RepID=A0ABW9VP74_9BURK|nr:hypothetical protein [Duganella qianjiadongensis]MYM40522.1 hypothetical protein [Duganella qianjiadongensis]
MTTIFQKPRKANSAIAVRAADRNNYELSGAKWAQRFIGSSSTKDLSSTFRKAVDAVKEADGKLVEVKTAPRSGMNKQMKAIGASYGVKKYIGGAKDKPHWSSTGR